MDLVDLCRKSITIIHTKKGGRKNFFPFGGQEQVVGPFSHHHMHNTEYTYVRPIRYSMLPPTTLGGCPTELVSALMNLCTYQTHYSKMIHLYISLLTTAATMLYA